MRDAAVILAAIADSPLVIKLTLIWGGLLSLCMATLTLYFMGELIWSLWSTRQSPLDDLMLVYIVPVMIALASVTYASFRLVVMIARHRVSGAAWLILVGLLELIGIQNGSNVTAAFLGSAWGTIPFLFAIGLPLLYIVQLKRLARTVSPQ